MDGWIVPLISIKGGGGKLAHDRRFVSNSLVESFFGISAILFEGGEGGVEMFQRSRGMRFEAWNTRKKINFRVNSRMDNVISSIFNISMLRN